MSKRFAWLLGILVLVLIGLLLACGNTYNSSSDGLVLVSSQGSGLLETFSFSLNSGSIAAVNNPPSDTGDQVCVLNGLPSSLVVDPAGAYAYTILTGTDICGTQGQAAILAFKVNSNGTMTAVGNPVADPNPTALVMDTTGKYLFVAEGLLGTVNSYALSGGNLTLTPGTFSLALPPGQGFQPPDLAAIAVTPMVLPPLVNGVQQAACSASGSNAPTAEYLYAADSVNNVVWEFGVDPSTGTLTNPPGKTQVAYFPSPSLPQTGPVLATPSGVAVDACNRFVYVANFRTNNVSAYTMCNGLPTQSPTHCPKSPASPDGSLVAVTNSPFGLSNGANGPGPMMSDPFGNALYVLDTLSNQVSTFRISPVTGSLTAGNPASVSTGLGPTSFAIRADDNWLFVANFNGGTISQYSIVPATGALTPLPPTTTDTQPWGVAVK